MSPYQVIKTISLTEKSAGTTEQLKYAFVVDRRARKDEIKRAIKALFDREVAKVNVMNYQGKTRRTRTGIGRRSDWKKAIVTLKEGQKELELF